MGAHARNSPSALHRTLNCPPSLVLGEQFQDEESQYAAEGSAGHALAEHLMQEFAVQDERVKIQLAKERVGLAQAEFDEEFDEENWQTLLELDKTGKVKDTLNNIANIIRYDPNLKAIVYNEFKSTIDVVPDRLVLFPGGRLAFVELKAPGKKMRPLQVKRAKQLTALGFRVYCVLRIALERQALMDTTQV